MKNAEILRRLADTIAARKQGDPAASYVAGLFAKGQDAILKKVAEEAAETVLAASIFHYGEYTVRQAKEYMAKRGIEVRL